MIWLDGSYLYSRFSAGDIYNNALAHEVLDVNLQASVPEPASMALMSFGLLGLVGSRRRKRS